VNFVLPRKPALSFIFVTLVLDILGIGLIVPILPKLVQSFQGGDVEAASHTFGWLTALYSLMQFIFAPVLGSLSDRFGRRRVILTSLLGSGLDYFVLALAPLLASTRFGKLVALLQFCDLGVRVLIDSSTLAEFSRLRECRDGIIDLVFSRVRLAQAVVILGARFVRAGNCGLIFLLGLAEFGLEGKRVGGCNALAGR